MLIQKYYIIIILEKSLEVCKLKSDSYFCLKPFIFEYFLLRSNVMNVIIHFIVITLPINFFIKLNSYWIR